MRLRQALTIPLVALAILRFTAGQSLPPQQVEFFEKRVRPILAARCQSCHNAKAGAAGLSLTSGAGLLKGSDTGPVVVPGNAEKSRLLQVVSYLENVKMPPTGKLSDEELTTLKDWVGQGAPWPPAASDEAVVQKAKAKTYSRGQREFWSFQPLRPVTPPAVKDESWIRSPIDRFILARLEAGNLQPAKPADKAVLIRRATLDLTGLPPTETDIQAFIQDSSPDAFAKVVDRLLASPRYGEKWGRHWLDVARYADSTGADEDHRYPHAWKYRDYVIDAFNSDLPFDEFIKDQIAGDLRPPLPGQEVNVNGIVATGFLALGPKLIAEQDKTKMFYDIVDEQIDVTGKAFLGLSIACARCHDHKFDPISTKDYYSMASIFASTKQLAKIEGTVSQLYYAPLVGKVKAGEYEAYQRRVEDKQKEIDGVVSEEARRVRDQLAPQMAMYMVAAQDVYKHGGEAAVLARKKSLDEVLLQRWVKYLTPTKERRVHLENWYQAEPPAVQAVADRYQADFIQVAAYRQKAQLEWKTKAEAAKAAGEKPPPPPKFMAGDNRFFTEVAGAKGPLALPEKEPETIFTNEGRAKWNALKAELKAVKDAAPPEPPFACGVAEGEKVEQHVFLRGNPESRGDFVPKAMPAIFFPGQQPAIEQGSGRLQLAQWLASPHNPLPSRVMVNRIWQGHFSEGIVRTANNFGIVGERPTHPELLDWLAQAFISRKWSVKAMHRLIMLSNVYQMSSEINDADSEKDADDRLLSHFPMRRMTIEELRDSLLQLDGTLDVTMGGTLQSGEGTDNEFSDGRKSLHPDNSKRRTVYLPLRRSNLATLLTLFDFGDGTTSTEIRSQTNVAPQALFMMNSNFVSERARSVAKGLLKFGIADEQRVRTAWVTVLGSEPTPDDVASSLEYVRKFPSKSADDGARLLAWSSFCRTLIASNDFLYVH